jgi:hypothetical protein
MEPANRKLVIFPGAVGFQDVLGMMRVLGVVAALLSDDCCGVVLRLMDSANCELVILPGAVGFEVVSGVLRVLGVATALLSDDCCGVVLRLMDPTNGVLVILPGAVGFEVVSGVLRVLGVFGVAAELLFDERCGVEKSCRVIALEVARA